MSSYQLPSQNVQQKWVLGDNTQIISLFQFESKKNPTPKAVLYPIQEADGNQLP